MATELTTAIGTARRGPTTHERQRIVIIDFDGSTDWGLENETPPSLLDENTELHWLLGVWAEPRHEDDPVDVAYSLSTIAHFDEDLGANQLLRTLRRVEIPIGTTPGELDTNMGGLASSAETSEALFNRQVAYLSMTPDVSRRRHLRYRHKRVIRDIAPERETEFENEIQAFAVGLDMPDGIRIVRDARVLVRAAETTYRPAVSVDVDGAL